jgi:AraC-like DNA-binding protein
MADGAHLRGVIRPDAEPGDVVFRPHGRGHTSYPNSSTCPPTPGAPGTARRRGPARQRAAASPASTGWTAALSHPVTTAALQAMHRDPARPWTVATLAAAAGLSRAPFARRFTALLGQPPLTYLTWWRMTIAARLLRHPTPR